MNDLNQRSTGQFDATPEREPEALALTIHQTKMFESMPVGSENAKFAIDIAVDSGFTVKYGRKLIKFLHTHGIIKWVPKGSAARYKKWYKPPMAT